MVQEQKLADFFIRGIGTTRAAKIAGVSTKTVYRWIASRRVKAVRIPGTREWIIDPESLPIIREVLD